MIQKVLKNMEGKWKYQQTIYNLQKHQTNYYQNTFLVEMENNNKIHFIYDKEQKKNYIEILQTNSFNKITTYNNNLNAKQYLYKQQRINLFKIKYRDNNVIYDETLNLINSNFFLSTIKIKYKNKYIAIAFNSYIKLS